MHHLSLLISYGDVVKNHVALGYLHWNLLLYSQACILKQHQWLSMLILIFWKEQVKICSSCSSHQQLILFLPEFFNIAFCLLKYELDLQLIYCLRWEQLAECLGIGFGMNLQPASDHRKNLPLHIVTRAMPLPKLRPQRYKARCPPTCLHHSCQFERGHQCNL